METAALDAASGRLMDVHGVLHDDRHLGLQLRIPDALLEELCGDSKEQLIASFSEPALLSTPLGWGTYQSIHYRTQFLL